MAALPQTKKPEEPTKEEEKANLLKKAQSMPDLLQKYNIDEVDPKLETDAER